MQTWLIDERPVLLDDADAAQLSGISWTLDSRGIRVIGTIGGTQTTLHRHLMGHPHGLVVDHINGNPLDNRRSNLRVCTQAENMRNRKIHANNKCGVKGVYFESRRISKPFRAQIRVDGRKILLGTFATLQEASDAYKTAAEKYHGEFARV